MFILNPCVGRPVVTNKKAFFFLPRTQAEINKYSYHFSLPLETFFLYPFTKRVALRVLVFVFSVFLCVCRGLSFSSPP